MKTFVKKSTYEKVMAMERTKRRNPLRPLFLLQILIRILSFFGSEAYQIHLQNPRYGATRQERTLSDSHESFQFSGPSDRFPYFLSKALWHRHHL